MVDPALPETIHGREAVREFLASTLRGRMERVGVFFQRLGARRARSTRRRS